ncbi:AMP-binding protein [Oceanidesulfovibrio indonesiensis]|uniref:AMP-binding protein n=1 Tax=Oceanidesulfovibrio indonesiensis TaxID=54767 RepID=UPI001F1759AC|nr:AMP-binding protein [Oceanidesulfovibrio indonesiensis]
MLLDSVHSTGKLTADSYEEFLERFSVEVPENFNFAYDFLDAEAATDPTRPAMVHVDDDGNRRDLDLAFFSSESSRMAQGLAKRGIGPGDRVLVMLYRRVEWWITVLALHKLGAVAAPGPHLLTTKDIEFRVDYAGIKAIVCEDGLAEKVDAARANCPSLTLLVGAGEGALPEGWTRFDDIIADGEENYIHTGPDGRRPGGADPLYIFFTSGTTGMPKMVTHPHTYPLGHLTTGMYWHDLKPGDLHLTLSDTGWAKSVWGKFYGQWLSGACIFTWDFRGKFTPDSLLGILAEHRITTFCAPPTVYRFLVREDLSLYDLSALRHCTTAGELLNTSVFESWKQSTGLNIYEGYGQTETCLQTATFPFMEPKPGSIGKPCPGWDLVLLDESGNPCPTGVEGEICIRLSEGRNLGLFTGYLDEPEKTATVMYDGYYHTGDKAWADEDGYFWFMGRNDDLIKSSGYRIGPFEVETALVSHPAVVEAAVTAVPDPVRGQAVKATLVLAQGYEPSDELTREIQDHVKKVTAPYKYPRVIDYVDELPKTISGKIKRAEIREKDESGN